MSDVLVIGAGPAGVTAAVYAARAGLSVLVIYRGRGALGKASVIENYYGFPEPIGGGELFERGIANAKRLGVEFLEEEVVDLAPVAGGIEVTLGGGAVYRGRAAVLATGSAAKLPEIPGVAEYLGLGVSLCAVCDAFFFRGKNVAVVGAGRYALHEAMVLSDVASSVRIFTDGEVPEVRFPFPVEERKIASFGGGERLGHIMLDGGAQVPLDGVFLAVGRAGSGDLARHAGVLLRGADVLADADGRTNIPGIYAAGDCVGGLRQISLAVASATRAALALIEDLRGK